MLDQDSSFYLRSSNILFTCLLNNVWITQGEVSCLSLLGVKGLTFIHFPEVLEKLVSLSQVQFLLHGWPSNPFFYLFIYFLYWMEDRNDSNSVLRVSLRTCSYQPKSMSSQTWSEYVQKHIKYFIKKSWKVDTIPACNALVYLVLLLQNEYQLINIMLVLRHSSNVKRKMCYHDSTLCK